MILLLYYIKKNNRNYTLNNRGPGPKLPAMYDFCKYECRTDTVGLSIVVVRPAWTYFKLFFHIVFTFGSLFFVPAHAYISTYMSTRIWLSPVTFYQNERYLHIIIYL